MAQDAGRRSARIGQGLLGIAGLVLLVLAWRLLTWAVTATPTWWLLGSVVVLALLGVLLRRRGRVRRAVVDVDLRGGAPEVAGRTAKVPDRVALVRALRRAADDPRVAAVVLRVGGGSLTPVAVQDLVPALEALRDAGVPTLALADTLGQLGGGTVDLALAAACERVVVQPGGEVGVTGLATTRPYLRGLLDRLGVVPRVSGRHEWKSAGELVERTGPSQYAEDEGERLTRGVRDQLVRLVASGRRIPVEDVEAAVAEAPLRAERAQELGLVDAVEDPAGAVERLREEHDGTLLPIVRYAGLPARSGAGRVEDDGGAGGSSQLASDPWSGSRASAGRPWWRRLRPGAGPRRATVGLVTATGAIVRGTGGPSLPGRPGPLAADPVVAALRSAAEDDDVDAVLLRVESRGGSAVASESLWAAVAACRAADTAVVVSMGDVAASGGYYLACGADAIVAQAATLTGSIGVVAGLVVVGPALERVGITHHTGRTDPRAGILSPWEDLTEAGEEVFEGWLDAVYGDFTERVAAGRAMDAEAVDAVARGRVWLGAEALEVGLVDAVGGVEVALEQLAALLGTEPRHLDLVEVESPDRGAWWQRLLGRLGTRLAASASAGPAPWLSAVTSAGAAGAAGAGPGPLHALAGELADLAALAGEPVLLLADVP